MRDLILAHEPAMRLGFFFGVLAVKGLWEIVAPRRPASAVGPAGQATSTSWR